MSLWLEVEIASGLAAMTQNHCRCYSMGRARQGYTEDLKRSYERSTLFSLRLPRRAGKQSGWSRCPQPALAMTSLLIAKAAQQLHRRFETLHPSGGLDKACAFSGNHTLGQMARWVNGV